MIRFTVPGRPIPTARPRVLKTGRTYLPARSRNAQKAVREAALEATGSQTPFWPEQALYVGIMACFPYPKGTPKKNIEKGWVPLTGRPDLDNLAKTVLDGCNDVVYADDAQIVELTVSKYRVEKAEDVGLYVEISTE